MTEPACIARDLKPVTLIGVNRAVNYTLPQLRAFNAETSRYALELIAVDPFPGRAEKFADKARALGMQAKSIEADARTLAESSIAPIVLLHVDDALALAALLMRFEHRHALFLLFVRTPNGQLITVSGAFEPGDAMCRHDAALLVAAFGHNAVAAGSEKIFGAMAQPEHRAIEPMFRHEFGARATRNIDKILANLPLEQPGLRLTYGGDAALATTVRDARETGFANPAVLAYQFFERSPFAVERGEDFVVAEVGKDGEIRLHKIRQRATDGAVTVGGMEVIDPRAVGAFDTGRWALAGQQRSDLLARAEREAITRRRPVYVSD